MAVNRNEDIRNEQALKIRVFEMHLIVLYGRCCSICGTQRRDCLNKDRDGVNMCDPDAKLREIVNATAHLREQTARDKGSEMILKLLNKIASGVNHIVETLLQNEANVPIGGTRAH